MTTATQSQQLRRTALAGEHEKLGAKMVDFHGWWMPLYCTSIIEEHRCVREKVGLFDVSHMAQIYFSGPLAGKFLQHMLTNDVGKLADGEGQYSLMLNEAGGILDDVVLFRLGPERFLLIVNCGTRERDLQWLRERAGGRVTIEDISNSHGIIAAQGPQAVAAINTALGRDMSGLERFTIRPLSPPWSPAFISRTGYTGSDGFEVFLPNPKALLLWRELLKAGQPHGIQPVGLGARDSLRLEVGYRLYGVDMNEETLPDEAGLEWVVASEKGEFVGRDALLKRRADGIRRQLVGFTMLDAGAIPRAQCPIKVEGRAVGRVTSGSMSPLLGIAIGLGYVETAYAKSAQQLAIEIRRREFRAQVVKLPFVQPR